MRLSNATMRFFLRALCWRRRSASSTTSSTSSTSLSKSTASSTASTTDVAATTCAGFVLSSFSFFLLSAWAFRCSCSASSFRFFFSAAFSFFSFSCCMACSLFCPPFLSSELESELEELSVAPFLGFPRGGLMSALRFSSSRRLSRLLSRSRSRSFSLSLCAVPGFLISRSKSAFSGKSGPPPREKTDSRAALPVEDKDIEMPSDISLPMNLVANALQKPVWSGATFAIDWANLAT
mmetsp:Transcript_18195/g.40679  ORF Transcript_18195/g.40679 Transcript_18195/m.40679 type:complete len:236 (+) Transcript_18195:119-826(+)